MYVVAICLGVLMDPYGKCWIVQLLIRTEWEEYFFLVDILNIGITNALLRVRLLLPDDHYEMYFSSDFSGYKNDENKEALSAF